MCKPASEGGQRCASHTRKGIVAAADAVAAAEATVRDAVTPEEIQAAHRRRREALEALNQAHVEHASTPTGLKEAQARLAEAEANGQVLWAVAERANIEQGTALREKNQAVAAALKAAEGKKAATTPALISWGTVNPKHLSEDEFEAAYGSITQSDFNEDESSYWEEPPAGYPENRIWTVKEGDDNENHYLVPGIHRVNRLGYIASEKPWTDPNIEVLWLDYDAKMER